MFNKIISVNTYQANFSEAIAVVSKLILTIEGSDDIDLILDAIKTYDFKQQIFFCDEEGMPLELTKAWKALVASTSKKEEKLIMTKYTNSYYDHKKEQTVSEWIIFGLMQGHWPIYKKFKTLTDTGNLDTAKQILTLHKEAVQLSKIIDQYFSSKQQSRFSKKNVLLLGVSRGFLGYKTSIEDLQQFIAEATAFLKTHQ